MHQNCLYLWALSTFTSGYNDQYGWEKDVIEAFIERVNDLRYEEISRADILERAKRETGIDMDGIIL